MRAVPTYTSDLFTDEALLDAYSHFAALRELGPVVWLEAHELYALPRFAEVRAALNNATAFRSGEGVGMNDVVNIGARGTTLMSDDELHTKLRGYMSRGLAPRALRSFQGTVEARADELVERLVTQGSFDAIPDLAQTLPLSLVPDLVGWPADGRTNLLKWAAASFNLLGPLNARAKASVDPFGEMIEFAKRTVAIRAMDPKGAAHNVFDGIDSGDITEEQAAPLILDYLAPSMDTTISAIGSMIRLFGQNPDQWRMLRSNPDLLPNAFNEVVRLESPIRSFTRTVVEPTSIGGVEVPARSRVLVMFASANRDERRWDNPESFDIMRDAAGQVGFGWGTHGCPGQGLARMEGQALLRSLIRRVKAIEVEEPTMGLNNLINSIVSLPTTLVAEQFTGSHN